MNEEITTTALLNTLYSQNEDARKELKKMGGLAVPLLLQAVHHADWGYRKTAIWALAEIGDVRAIPAIVQALEEPSWQISQLAQEGLIKIATTETPLFIQVLQNADAKTAWRLLGTIELINNWHREELFVAGLPHFVGLLGEIFPNVHADIRRGIAGIVGNIRSPQTISLLIQALHDSDGSVRQAAAQALERLGDPQAAAPLCQALLQDSEPTVRQAAAQALERLGDPQAVAPLCQALLQDSEPTVRQAAAQALKHFCDPQTFTPLCQALLQESETTIRQEIVQTLERLGDLQAVISLCQALLKESQTTIRQEIVLTLGRLGGPQAIVPLSQGLDDPDWWVRKFAKEALHTILSRVDTVMFGWDTAITPADQTSWKNPIVSEQTIPLQKLRTILIDPLTCHPYQLECFVTYAVNALGPKYLKQKVIVYSYSDFKHKHLNLYNALFYLCREVIISTPDLIFKLLEH